MNKDLRTYQELIHASLEVLYSMEAPLFENNLCERCINFRFAHHLQNLLSRSENNSRYFVDCDYNSSAYFDKKLGAWTRRNGKPIRDQIDGQITKRFIDIIVHKRETHQETDLICFETKKWNNCTDEGVAKDYNNLIRLTSQYGYYYGFHLTFGKTLQTTRILTYENGKEKLT